MSAMLHTRAVTPPPSSHPPGDNLAPGDIEDLAAELVAYHAHFALLFRRAEQRHWARQYLAGQLLDLERKSIEPMALALAGGNVQALQQFIGVGAWDDEAILQRHQELVAETLGDPATGVLIIAGCDFPKQGRESVGVARQWCGAQGKIAHCQAGVVACYASARGYTLVDRRLYRLWHAFRAGEWADLADSIAIPLCWPYSPVRPASQWARAAWMSALLGTQPVWRQSPPRAAAPRSISATRAPSATPKRAAVSPAEPPPITARSYMSPMRCSSWHRRRSKLVPVIGDAAGVADPRPSRLPPTPRGAGSRAVPRAQRRDVEDEHPPAPQLDQPRRA